MSLWRQASEFWRDGPRGSIESHRILSAILAAAGILAAVWLDRAEGGWTLWGAIFLTATVAGGMWWLGERRAASIEQVSLIARSEALLDLGHSLEPLARELGRVAALGKTQRRWERQSLRKAVLAAAQGLSSSRLRACYFELQPDGQSMTYVDSLGRAIRPTEGFYAGKKSGDAALRMVKDGDHLFCDDTEKSPPAGWVASRRREYCTFISVTVGTPDSPSGMLTLDAPAAGDLTEEDVRMMLVLGHLLGLAEQITS